MKKTIGMMMVVVFCGTAWAQIESNDSPQALTNAQARVELKLQQFAASSTNYELLLEAQKIAASLNPRGDNTTNLSALDEDCLRLQLKVLAALTNAVDPHYDFHASSNSVYMNMIPPLPDTNGMYYPSGIDPNVIKDPKARKAYLDELAENERRLEKLKREMYLSRGVDYALLDIWLFVRRGLEQNPVAQTRAIGIVTNAISDKVLLEHFNSTEMPGLYR